MSLIAPPCETAVSRLPMGGAPGGRGAPAPGPRIDGDGLAVGAGGGSAADPGWALPIALSPFGDAAPGAADRVRRTRSMIDPAPLVRSPTLLVAAGMSPELRPTEARMRSPSPSRPVMAGEPEVIGVRPRRPCRDLTISAMLVPRLERSPPAPTLSKGNPGGKPVLAPGTAPGVACGIDGRPGALGVATGGAGVAAGGWAGSRAASGGGAGGGAGGGGAGIGAGVGAGAGCTGGGAPPGAV